MYTVVDPKRVHVHNSQSGHNVQGQQKSFILNVVNGGQIFGLH